MPKPDHKAYTAVHVRLLRSRGSAAQHQCIDCGQIAREWSYNHSQSNVRYSLNLDDYDPRCRACHVRFDLQYRRSVAEPLAAEVKHAVRQRNSARKHNDTNAESYWDDELDRLAMLLRAI
jgi:hypothetical protein